MPIDLDLRAVAAIVVMKSVCTVQMLTEIQDLLLVLQMSWMLLPEHVITIVRFQIVPIVLSAIETTSIQDQEVVSYISITVEMLL
jgi:hypothetical protein